MNKRLLAAIFGIAYVVLIGSAFSQPAQPPGDPQSASAAQRDDRQDVATTKVVTDQDLKNAVLEARMQVNSDALAMMNARNQFWIQVLQTIMPVISAIGIAAVAWLQVKAARERQHMAQSINGMKSELVAVTKAAAFYEGAMTEAGKHSDGPSPVVARGLELSAAAQVASEEANRLASIAAKEKPYHKQRVTTVEVETMRLAPGDTATSEATAGGGAVVTKDP